jgi:two-component system heavy metal sensor histidine kinase CusS
MKPFSLTARISLLFAVAAALVLLAMGFILSRAVESHFLEADRRELDGKVELIRNLLARTDTQAAYATLPRQLNDALVGHHGLSVAVADAVGKVWFATPQARFPATLLRHESATARSLREWRDGDRSYRGMGVGAMMGTGEPQTIAVALDMSHHKIFMAEFSRMLALAMALAAAVTAGLGWIATRRGLAPLRRVTDMAATVSAERLGTQLPATAVPAELESLVAAFNDMLARLDDSFRRLNDFSSDIAHEFRTPITNLMTQTQVALGRARDADEYREILHSNLEEYERLARMIGDMLFLAKADNRLLVPERESVDLEQEVARLLEFYEALAGDRGVRLMSDGSARTNGDRLMLRRALSNLLSNAIRFTPAGGAVRVTLASDDEGAIIAVANPGPRISPEHLPHLFDRFYRVDSARRNGKEEHTGLGLAIAKAIVEAHGGRVTVSSDANETRFSVVLPR